MARQKQSFFGKIMGGNVADEEVVEKVYIEQDYSDEGSSIPVAVEGFDESQEDEEEETGSVADEELEEGEDYSDEGDEGDEYEDEDNESSDDPVPAKPAPVSSPISKQDEDWMTDYEGALNIDMYQTKDNVIIKSTIAGVRPDDIDITVANDMVTIQGSRSREEKIHDDDYFYQECYWGGFSRSVIVPVDIDSEHIEADLKDGILTIIVPKAAKAKTKKVKVKGL